MGFAALAVGVPLAVGLAANHPVQGVLAAVGGLIGAMSDQFGPYAMRLRRIAAAGIVGGAGGLLLGTAIHGRGWVVVGVMVVVAGVSALLSSVSAMWSTTGMFLLVYTLLAVGPLGAIRPWWESPLWLLAGVGWALVLLLPGWLLRPRTAEQRRVATVYRALAANLRTVGSDGHGAARKSVTADLNSAYQDLEGRRATASGRDPELARLVILLGQARLVAETAAALGAVGERPPVEAAAQAEAIAEAVLDGRAVPEIEPPVAASPPMFALYAALDTAADVASRRRVTPAGTEADIAPTPRRRPSLAGVADAIRERLVSTFAIRLMLCIGVASVLSHALPLQRSYWVPLAVAVVIKPDFGSVLARALQYGAGTVVGAIAGALIVAAAPPDPVFLVPVVVFAALLPYGMSRNYGLFGVFFTPLVVLLIELLSHGGWELAEARLIDILLGCGIVLVVGYAPWPSSWHANLPRDFADALDDAATYFAQALKQPAPGAAASAHARARRKHAALDVEFQRVLAEPPRVREQVTAWWPAVVALGQLLEAVTATAVTTAGQPPPPAAVSELTATLRRMATAVRSGTTVRAEREPPGVPALEQVSEAVRSLQDALTDAPPPQQTRQRLARRMSQFRWRRVPDAAAVRPRS
jgi:uncharacterized membrane protein YccC